MNEKITFGERPGAMLTEGPWGRKGSGGGSGSGGDDGDSGDGDPPNPWSQPPGGGKPRRPRGNSALDELTSQVRARFGGGLPSGSIDPLVRLGLLAFAVLWITLTSFHRIGPQQEGVITRFGAYAGKLEPGIGMTFPAPIDQVEKVDVQGERHFDVPEGSGENLILTGDQNLVNVSYGVRWSVRDPAFYEFQLAKPDDTVKEVAESAMREVIGTVTLADALGPGRSMIQQRVAARMQALLDSYKSGIFIRGVAVKPAGPPTEVNEAFKQVTVKQQEMQANINNANTYAQQIKARAEGEAAAFDKVYAQYKLAPGVTRRRMYYETMEAVLGNTDKTIVEPNGIAPYLPLGASKPRVIVEDAKK
jgi:membrane protease subunit HflK